MSSATPPHGELERDTDPGVTRAEDVVDDGDIQPGTMVGEYRIEHRIGKGGMGIVFAAVHPLIGKRVAIKVLRNDICNDRVAVERFIDEARVVNQIEHPNIVDIFAFGELEDGRNYFVMEWLRGESLRDLMDRTRVPIAQVCEILANLVRALTAAHGHGIVHRDLKPDNVFLVEVKGEQTLVKLLDFGVAKLNEKDLRSKRVANTATGTIVGTPQYLSPEQARGHEVDYRADIYALGGIAFELLTGRTPFVADNVMEMVAKHIMEAPVSPSSLAPGIPPELDALVVATLAKSVEDRPTLEAWLAVLERVKHPFEGERVWPIYNTPAGGTRLTPPPSPTPMPAAPLPAKEKRPWVMASVAAIVVLGTAAVVFATTNSDQGTPMVLPTLPTVVVVKKPVVVPAVQPPVVVEQVPTPPPIVQDTVAVPKAWHHHRPEPVGSAAPKTNDDDELLAPGSIQKPQ